MVSASSVSMVVAENGLIPLDEAYERCRCETEEWAKTFYLGTMLMPPDKRRAIWAIYVWCRVFLEILRAYGVSHDQNLGSEQRA